jgi:hypothetical protein
MRLDTDLYNQIFNLKEIYYKRESAYTNIEVKRYWINFSDNVFPCNQSVACSIKIYKLLNVFNLWIIIEIIIYL